MIIIDSTEGSGKASKQPPEGTTPPNTNDPPPTYTSSSAVALPPGPAMVYPDEQRQPLLPNNATNHPRSARRRFCRAFSVAVFIWLLLSLLVRSIVGVTKWARQKNPWTGEFPIPSDIHTLDCAEESNWRNVITSQDKSLPPGSWFSYTSQTEFDLPLTSETLFLVSRGATFGSTTFQVSDNTSDVVHVEVTVRYRSWDVRDQGTKVCRITREDNSTGVGVFNRRNFNWDSFKYHLYYNIVVQLPASAHINNFETDLPNTSHQLEDLKDRVSLGSISLKSSNAPISVKSLTVKEGRLQSSNAPIMGIFNATNSLRLKTSNAPIMADVTIENNDSSVSHLAMHTTNNKLTCSINLKTSKSEGGQYLVETTSTNGPLQVNLPELPLKSTLRLLATSSNSPATVSLHPAYEGSFTLHSSHLKPRVENRELPDPSGKHRRRSLRTYSSGTKVTGSVSWSSQESPSRVEVQTSNSPVTLIL